MPLFIVFRPHTLPESKRVTEHWRNMAAQAGLKGLFLVGLGDEQWEPEANGFDGSSAALISILIRPLFQQRPFATRLKRKLLGQPGDIYDYASAIDYFHVSECSKENVFPCMIPNWDNTSRFGRRGMILHNSNPQLFKKHAQMLVDQVRHKPVQKRIVFLKSWNEWAEGNHLEPDIRYGHAYLEALRSVLRETPARKEL
jgi:hypothetical protein